MKKKTKKSLLPYLFLLLFMLTVLYFVSNMNNKVNVLSYDEFVVSINEGKIAELNVTPKSNAGVYDLSGKLKNYKENETFFVRVPLSDEIIGKILNTNDDYNFKLVTEEDPASNSILLVIVNLLPILIVVGATFFIFSRHTFN